MVKGIHIIKYRKLENMELEFSKGINVLSGTKVQFTRDYTG